MGAELLESSAVFAEGLRVCAGVLDPLTGWSLVDVVRGVTTWVPCPDGARSAGRRVTGAGRGRCRVRRSPAQPKFTSLHHM
ncbi:hypothetical protein [Streptomyces asiaticus]